MIPDDEGDVPMEMLLADAYEEGVGEGLRWAAEDCYQVPRPHRWSYVATDTLHPLRMALQGEVCAVLGRGRLLRGVARASWWARDLSRRAWWSS